MAKMISRKDFLKGTAAGALSIAAAGWSFVSCSREAVQDGIIMDGIITSSDRAAFGARRALQRIGYFVPEDVRLVSFDNSPYAAFASPSLTTLDRRPEELAKRASDVLCACMEGKPDIRQTNIIDVSLIPRGSSR